MKFALVDNSRMEAQPKLQGLCPICFEPVIAKCGTEKVWHWAHRSKTTCDSWWERETEWHRAWKNYYPIEWQEISLPDEKTGEKHIADIRTAHNLVIEFQHSHIDPQERTSREKFYGNMIWVVDGTRLKRDYSRFQKGINNSRHHGQDNEGNYLFSESFPEDIFNTSWLNSSVPIIFDFQGIENEEKNEYKEILWCLLPQKGLTRAIIVGLTREYFFERTLNFSQLLPEDKKEMQQEPQKRTNTINRRPTRIYSPYASPFTKRQRGRL